MNIVARFKRLPVSTKRLLSIGVILAFVIALPLFVWAIVTQRFNILPRAASGEIPGTVQFSISEEFTGPGALNPSRWNWSGSVGSSVTIFNNELKITVPAGHDSVGGNDAVAQALVNYQIPSVVSTFSVQVDLAGVDSTNGYEALKFAPNGAVMVRRTKIGAAETLEGWSSPDNSNFTKVISVDIPAGNGPVTIAMTRVGDNIDVNYKLTPQGAFTPFINISQQGLGDNAALPRMVVENLPGDYPQTTGYFDNYIANGVMLPVSSATAIPSPTATPYVTGSHCGLCGGIANIQCQAGLTCYKAPRTVTPDSAGICIDQRGPAFCPGASPLPTCQPRPACLDSNPRCLPPEPIGGWCPTTCVRKPPTVTLTPETKSGNPGDQILYTFNVTNNDNSACARETFSLAVKSIEVGWITALSNTLMQLFPGGTGNGQVAVTSPVNPMPSPGPYSVQVGVSGPSGGTIARANYNVLPTTPPATSRPFVINYKLMGVTDDSASQNKQATNAAKIVVKFLSPVLGSANGFVTPPITTDYSGNGVYTLHFGVLSNNLPAANNYAITLKSEKSVATKFCTATGQTTHCSGAGTISIPTTGTQTVNLDFTGIPLQPGDLQPQDGAVTTLGENSDLARLLGLMARPHSALTEQDLATGDLNYDGFIDIRDLYLFRITLQTRYDE